MAVVDPVRLKVPRHAYVTDGTRLAYVIESDRTGAMLEDALTFQWFRITPDVLWKNWTRVWPDGAQDAEGG